MITLEFLITSLIVVLIPGPGVVLTVSRGIIHGRRASVFTAIGCTAGIVPQERFELNALNAIAVMVDRGLGVSLVPDWARPWPEGLNLVRLPLPLACEPRSSKTTLPLSL